MHDVLGLGGVTAGRTVVSGEALVFDMDGVLVDSTGAVEGLWADYAERIGVDVARLDLHGRRSRDVIVEWSSQGAEEDLNWFAARELNAPIDGALPGVELLASLTCPWAIVTSGDAALAEVRLSACGIRMPDVIITGDRVARGKPDPEGYLEAAARLGVAPSRMIAFEDSPPGVSAVKAAGMQAVALGTTHGFDELVHADWWVSDLASVAAESVACGIEISFLPEGLDR